MKAKIFTLVFLFCLAALSAQTTLLEYNFNGNLNPTVAGPSVTSLEYFTGNPKAPGTPDYNSNWLRVPESKNGDYLELKTNTTGIVNMALSFKAKLHALGLTAHWIVEANTGSGNSFEEIGRIELWSILWIPFENSFNITLPPSTENKSDLIIRIHSSFSGSVLAALDIDNLKITYGNPNIQVYTDGTTVAANLHIPHLSAPSPTLDTDFGTTMTSGPAVTRGFRVRNLNGTKGSNLNVDSIVVKGAHPYDFSASPDQLSTIGVSSSSTGNPYKTFNITFIPTADGIRTAEIYLYSNAYGNNSHNPYIFNVVGMGASCNLEVTTFAENDFTYGQQQSLPGTYTAANIIGGKAKKADNTLNIQLYPYQAAGWLSAEVNPNLFTSASTSWYVRNDTKTLEFGPLKDINIQKDVQITFRLAAFATASSSSTGVTSEDYITLSVLRPNNSWSEELKLTGSKNSSTHFKYDFVGGDNLAGTYDGDNQPKQDYNETNRHMGGLSWKTFNYKQFTLSIPASANITDLKFRIIAKSGADSRLWLIDDVRVLTSNSVYKTYTTAGNWVPSEPSQNEKAVIEGNYVNAGHPEVCECEVEEGGSLTIPNGTSVTLRGKVINHGDGSNFTVESGGNLIQLEEAENIGPITVERSVTNMKNTAPDFGYVYWSSPVEGQGLADFSPGTPATGEWGFLEYDTETDYFENVILASEPEFLPGKGYAIRTEDAAYDGLGSGYNKTYRFLGVPHNGEFSYPINTKSGEDYGYNLVGNPYPSNLSADKLYQLNNGQMHYWFAFWTNNEPTGYQEGDDYTGNNYAILNGTGGTPPSYEGEWGDYEAVFDGSIGVGQGFIIAAKEGADELVFRNRNPLNNEMLRIADPAPFFQKGEKDRFWLTLTSPHEIVNTALIGYIPGATNEYDGDFDAAFWGSDDAIYSLLEDTPLIIQGREYPLDNEDLIPLGTQFSTEGVYTIALKDPEGTFAKNTKIWIRDKQLGLEHNLSRENYKFYAEPGNFEDRFELFYKEVSFSTSAENTNIFSQAGTISVTREGQNIVILSTKNNIFAAEVFNIVGWPVYGAENINAKEHRIPAAHLSNNILFVRVKDETGRVSTHKLIAK